jgi:hypothetical protein
VGASYNDVMLRLTIPCTNPWDSRESTVHVVLWGEDVMTPSGERWCDLEHLNAAVAAAFSAIGRASWDTYDLAAREPGGMFAPPWIVQSPRRTPGLSGGPSTDSVQIPEGYEVIRKLMDGRYLVGPTGWPPDVSHRLTDAEAASVRTSLEASFGRNAEFSSAHLLRVARALRRSHRALNSGSIRMQCGVRSCTDRVVALWNSDRIRLCNLFFRVSVARSASAILEELLHGYAGTYHPLGAEVLPPTESADYYQQHLLQNYLV